ncbi:hypothetical protein ACFWA5_49185 [Streptomyces mirabilis]|uniref:hypothetical protein n=1 Tax=Streptomyces mirabilis TaxID=68239 RepID=UPI003646D509
MGRSACFSRWGPGRAKYLEGQEGLSTEETSLDDLDLSVLDERVPHDRDLLLAEALRALQERHEMDDLEIAVVYGARHMPAVVRHLATVYGHRPMGAEWLTVYRATY